MRHLKDANIFVWGGAGLLLLGIALSASSLSTYITSGLRTTPPPRSMTRPTQVSTAPTPTTFSKNSAQALPRPIVTLPITPTPARPPASPTSYPVLTTRDSTTSTTHIPTIAWMGAVPTYLRIPAINLEAPIVSIDWETVTIDDTSQATWRVPDWYAAGWHRTSAKLGVPGNTVLNGHNTGNGEVFRNLHTLKAGASILVDADDGKTYTYEVEEIYFLKEANQPLEVRIENARYIQATDDERLTLVTCHPYGSFAQRLLVIAYPAPESKKGHIEGE